jgi:Flp pilus assembly protein TadG
VGRFCFQLVSEWARDCRGNIATIFALTLLPITVLSGGAIDYNQAMNSRTRLAQSLDAAALAVGTDPTIDSAEALIIANDFMNANYPSRELGTVVNLSVSIDDSTGSVKVSGEALTQTFFLGLVGLDAIRVHWESEVVRAHQDLELVMVLDNTGSMSGSKISALRDSAALLNEVLFAGASEPDDVNVGLVPFAATVNVGTGFAREWWLDPDAESPIHAEWSDGDVETTTCTGRGRRRRCTTTTQHPNHWDLFDQLRNTSWSGCVEARSIPMDIDDTTPSRSRPETLFVPYFSPDEPNRSGYYNSYLSDGVSGSDRDRMRNLSKYDDARPSGGGPNDGCTTNPITPLTNSESTIDRAIGNMGASGATNIPNGIGWGIRVISPGVPFTEGTAWDDRDVVKAMVILTDGENYYRGRGHYYNSSYSAYGYSRFGRLGTTSASSTRLAQELDERTTAACDAAKDLGIRVYTITFQVNSSSTRELMEACASHPTLYFDSPSSAALRDAFEVIAGDLSNLRISQ